MQKPFSSSHQGKLKRSYFFPGEFACKMFCLMSRFRILVFGLKNEVTVVLVSLRCVGRSCLVKFFS